MRMENSRKNIITKENRMREVYFGRIQSNGIRKDTDDHSLEKVKL